jgi:hypothetical protein
LANGVIADHPASYRPGMRIACAFLLALVAGATAVGSATAAPKLAPAERKTLNRTIDKFVLHAVRHKNPAAAYFLISPQGRSGLTKKQFAKQDPIYPFNAKGHHFPWSVDYVEPAEIGGSILLQPVNNTKFGPILFDLRLTKHHGAWLVESLIPKVIFGPPGSPKVRSVRDYSPQSIGNSGPTYDRPKITGDYIVIPLALFGAFLAFLAAWGAKRWYSDRRIARESASVSVRARDSRARATN